jgi:hypothetical protein
VHKTYTFVYSDQVPGGLYQLQTSLGKPATVRTAAPAAGTPDASPAIDETLTLISFTPEQP